VARHLRSKHAISAADAKSWKKNFIDQVRDVEYDPVLQEIFEWANPLSCQSKTIYYYD
jgi:hypothetical protein